MVRLKDLLLLGLEDQGGPGFDVCLLLGLKDRLLSRSEDRPLLRSTSSCWAAGTAVTDSAGAGVRMTGDSCGRSTSGFLV